MSTNESIFRSTMEVYAAKNGIPRARRKNEFGFKFAVKGEEVICIMPMKRDWTHLFHFDGADTVSIKKRLSEEYTEMCTIDAFEIAYGKGATA